MCFAGTLNRFSALCAALSHCGGSEPGPMAGPWFCVLASLLASSPCGCARVSQLHPPSLCQLQNCAHYRVRPSTERGSLGRGMGLFSACCIPPEQSLCPLFTGVPISYNPIPLLCQEQALQSAVCNPAAGRRGAEGVLHIIRQVFCSGSALQYLSPCTWITRPFSSVSAGPWWKQDR